jgi:alanine or glycine:cation symporter, AGCS family
MTGQTIPFFLKTEFLKTVKCTATILSVDTMYTDSEQTTFYRPDRKCVYFPTLLTDDGTQIDRLFGGVVENGAPLTARAFEIGLAPFLPGGGFIVTFAVLLFAVSTSISWSYYGDRAAQYLFGFKSIFWYRIAFVGMHFFGAVVSLTTIWAFGDVMLGLMAFFNIIALVALSGVAVKITREIFRKHGSLKNSSILAKH